MAVVHYNAAANARAPWQYMHAAFTGQSYCLDTFLNPRLHMGPILLLSGFDAVLTAQDVSFKCAPACTQHRYLCLRWFM